MTFKVESVNIKDGQIKKQNVFYLILIMTNIAILDIFLKGYTELKKKKKVHRRPSPKRNKRVFIVPNKINFLQFVERSQLLL